MPRLALAACAALALVAAPAATSGGRGSSVAAGVPTNLRAFLLRADEPISHAYARTPSFVWSPVPEHGGHYQFELATSRSFEDGTIVFRDTHVPIPAETIPRQLPWMTGDPYALWAHVRWISDDGRSATRWSKPFGFNLTWAARDVPKQLPAPEGLVRWKPVEGATAYQVLYTDLRPAVSFVTTTNVADEREFFTFHAALGYSTTIHWRVRAIRDVSRMPGPLNGLPVVSYGPWSPVFSTTNAPQAPGRLKPTDTVSDAWDKTGKGRPHQLTPGFAWSPTAPDTSGGIDPGSPLYRVYVFTDRHCVNRVFTGSVVGSPAFAPRATGGPIALPAGTAELQQVESGGAWPGAGKEGNAIDATGAPVTATEGTAGSAAGASPGPASGSSAGTGTTATTAPSGSLPSGSAAAGSASGGGGAGFAPVDLWDSGWPTGRYWWTVVPVTVIPQPGTSASGGGGTGGGGAGSGGGGAGGGSDTAIEYQDAAVPQDACESGERWAFGKVSRPVVTAAGKPFVSGVAPTGRSVLAVDATHSVYQTPIVAWEPAIGATTYQVELSRSLYPWRVARTLTTPATSVMLPLTRVDAGTWFYRVRGINQALPVGAQAMTWSTPIRIRITGDRFAIVK